MGLAAGIIGLPNVGKSTIFTAISSAKADAQNYPFCTIDPNRGMVAVPDPRLGEITSFIPTQKVVPAILELVDIAGLVKGASQGEGLGNQFLGHIKDVSAVAHVVRCFEDPDIVHVEGGIDPARDVEIIETELMLKDLETVEKAMLRVGKQAKTGDKKARADIEIMQKAQALLQSGTMIYPALDLTDPEISAALQSLHLLTAKPVLFVANVDEEGLSEKNEALKQLEEIAQSRQAGVVPLCGKIESELAELSAAEAEEFLQSLGQTEPGLHRLAREMYQLLGLQTFFTAGEKETRAWTIPRGASAPQAAGVIHTDFERGFIKADVYTLADLRQHKTEVALRAAGKIRSEGKEYIVADGDILFFKFNV